MPLENNGDDMPPAEPTVFVVDDDASIRESLSLLLQSAGYAVQVFASAKEFMDTVGDLRRPACLVSDVKMPGINGLELQDKLAATGHPIPMIFMTAHGDIPMSVKAIKKGAVDFLTKPFEDMVLLAAVEEALAKGEKRCEEEKVNHRLQQRLETLTPREREVLTYLIAGLLNKQIAYELDIAERTVKAHRKQVMHKMGVDSIAELVRLTEKAGITPADVTR